MVRERQQGAMKDLEELYYAAGELWIHQQDEPGPKQRHLGANGLLKASRLSKKVPPFTNDGSLLKAMCPSQPFLTQLWLSHTAELVDFSERYSSTIISRSAS